jgi:lysophospholipase L1-like esterase
MQKIQSMGRGLFAMSVVASVLVVLTPSSLEVAAATTPHYANYVALGDSYTADVFTTFPPTDQYVPIGCGQSASDYPHQLAKLLHVTSFFDASCGSATTDNMTGSESLPTGQVNPPQFAHLSAATNLVTIGIGGNDVGLVGEAESCLNLLPTPIPGAPEGLGGSCAAKDTAGGVDQIAQDIAATAPKIATVLKEIHTLAPHARILLVNYLDAVPLNGKGCYPLVPVQNEDIAYLADKFVEMNNMLGWMATLSHVQVVDVFSATIGHDVCQAPNVRYVEGIIPLSLNPPALNFPLHPNGAGAEAQTQAVYAAIEGRS